MIETKRAPVAVSDVNADGTFSGYASIFDAVDLGRDKVARGAFRRSLAQRGVKGIRMLYQHDPVQPVGFWGTIVEDAVGLRVEGCITPGTARADEILALLRSGALDGLSIGFRTQRSRTDRRTGIRTILEADLYEVSLVTFPMLPAARVSQVSAAPSIAPSVREIERRLTQDAGLTRSQARRVLALGLHRAPSFEGTRDAADQNGVRVVDAIRRATQRIHA